MEQYGEKVEQYGGTVKLQWNSEWNSMEQCGTVWWNSVEQYGGTVEQYGGTVEQRGTVWHTVVEQCGTAWWNSETVWCNSGTV